MNIDTYPTAWKVSKYGVLSSLYFRAFTGKYGPEKTQYLETIHTNCYIILGDLNTESNKRAVGEFMKVCLLKKLDKDCRRTLINLWSDTQQKT